VSRAVDPDSRDGFAGHCILPNHSYQFELQLTPDQCCRPLKAFDCDVTFGFQDPINLSEVRVHPLGKNSLGNVPSLHFLVQLRGYDAGQRLGLSSFPNAFVHEKRWRAVETAFLGALASFHTDI
jgi:hypothetical protein